MSVLILQPPLHGLDKARDNSVTARRTRARVRSFPWPERSPVMIGHDFAWFQIAFFLFTLSNKVILLAVCNQLEQTRPTWS